MTTQVQATIVGLVSEVDHLNARVKRYERSRNTDEMNPVSENLVGGSFVRALDKALGAPPPVGYTRELALIVVKTFEDIRTGSGLLSENSTLMDVAQRIGEADLGAAPIGLVDGPTVAVLLTRPVLPTVPETESSELPASTADKL